MSRDFDEESLEIEARERAENREDRRTLLRVAGNIASGLMSANGGWVSAGTTCETIAKSCVALARAILEEVDRGE